MVKHSMTPMKMLPVRWLAIQLSLCAALLGANHASAQGSPLMGMGSGPRFDGHMAKLFGPHQFFSCALEVEAKPSDRPDGVALPGRLNYAEGKSRLEMDLTKIKGGMMPAGMIDQIKALGMAEMAIISRPADGTSVLVYPGLKSYAPIRDASTTKSAAADQYTMAAKELGKEPVDGQDCVKNQVTVTGPDGKKFEATVWNSTKLKSFPVRIRSEEGGVPFTLNFKEVKFEKPSSALFENPASYTKYDDAQALMRGVIMKKMSEATGGAGAGK